MTTAAKNKSANATKAKKAKAEAAKALPKAKAKAAKAKAAKALPKAKAKKAKAKPRAKKAPESFWGTNVAEFHMGLNDNRITIAPTYGELGVVALIIGTTVGITYAAMK